MIIMSLFITSFVNNAIKISLIRYKKYIFENNSATYVKKATGSEEKKKTLANIPKIFFN